MDNNNGNGVDQLPVNQTQKPRDGDPLNLSPHSVDAEEATLGSILMYPQALDEVRTFLTPDDYFILRHGWIHEALIRLADRDDAIDTRTLAEELRTQGRLDDIGGEAYLNYLPNTMPTALHAPVYGEIVRRAAIRRRLLGAAGQIAELAHNEEKDILDVINQSQAAIFDVQYNLGGSSIVTLEQAVSETREHLEAIRNGTAQPFVIDTPWKDLNKVIPGLIPGMHIIGARQKGGKSAAILQWATHSAKKKLRTHILSMEMTVRDIMSRLIAQETGLTKEQQNTMTEKQHGELVEWFGSSVVDLRTLSFDDNIRQTPSQIASQCRNMKRRGNLDILVVDYVGLITPDTKRQSHEELSDTSRTLAKLAIELEIPIITAAQLNRASTHFDRPKVEHLAGSDALGRDAMSVTLIHDPETEKGAREFIVVAQRNGPSSGSMGVIPMTFIDNRVMFADPVKPYQLENQPPQHDHVYRG